MAEPTEIAFRTNPNKDFLRGSYDKRVIATWAGNLGRPLEYLGLPGPDMLDVVEWQDLLGRFTAIERRENEQHLMFVRANVRDVEHRLHALYGEFDDILRTGRDRYGHAPRWPYDLVNLDFFGGLVYRNLARVDALSKLIRNQETYEHSFLLIITHDLRDADILGEKLSFFDDLGRQLIRDTGKVEQVSRIVGWYKDAGTPDAARQAAYTNTLLRESGETAHFKVLCRPAITYRGTGGVKMIHYVTEFRHDPRGYRAFSDQSLVDILNLGVRDLQDGQLVDVIEVPKLA